MPDWLERWISPAGVLLLMGGIVWGVQLNVAVMQLTEAVSADKANMQTLSAQIQSISTTQARTAVILQHLEKTIEATDKHVAEHERESSTWKQRIIRLEEGVKNGHRD